MTSHHNTPARHMYILTKQLRTHVHRIHRTSPNVPYMTACGVHVACANEPHYPPPPNTPQCQLCFTNKKATT